MKCVVEDIYRDAGDTYPMRFGLWSSNTRDYVDITDYEFEMVVSEVKDPTPGDSTELFTMTGNIVTALTGRHEFAPSDAQAADYTGELFYECRYTDTSNKIRTYRKGRYIVR